MYLQASLNPLTRLKINSKIDRYSKSTLVDTRYLLSAISFASVSLSLFPIDNYVSPLSP